MNLAKALLGLFMIILSCVGFVLTYDISNVALVDSNLQVLLPAILAIFSLMFMLMGITFLLAELDTIL